MNLGFIVLKQSDFHRLKRELLILGALVGSIVVFHAVSFYLFSSLAEQRQEAESQKQQASEQLSRVQTELHDLRYYTPLYNALTERGVIGKEQRLEWLELLEKSQQSSNVIAIQYRFAPQAEPKSVPAGLRLSAYKLYTSPLELTLHALHEEQVLHFLQLMEKNAQGLPFLNRCEMAKSTAAQPPVRLTASCHFEWYTLQALAPSEVPQ